MDCAEPGTGERRLYAAVLLRYVMDARSLMERGSAGDGGEALADLQGSQRILRRLCALNDLDVESTAAAILKYSVSDTGKLQAAA